MSFENITLNAIKVNKAMSEETLNFSANILYMGKKVGVVMNHGTGGANFYRKIEKPKSVSQQLFDEAWEVIGHGSYELDDHVENLLIEADLVKAARRMIKRGCAIVIGVLEKDDNPYNDAWQLLPGIKGEGPAEVLSFHKMPADSEYKVLAQAG